MVFYELYDVLHVPLVLFSLQRSQSLLDEVHMVGISIRHFVQFHVLFPNVIVDASPHGLELGLDRFVLFQLPAVFALLHGFFILVLLHNVHGFIQLYLLQPDKLLFFSLEALHEFSFLRHLRFISHRASFCGRAQAVVYFLKGDYFILKLLFLLLLVFQLFLLGVKQHVLHALFLFLPKGLLQLVDVLVGLDLVLEHVLE